MQDHFVLSPKEFQAQNRREKESPPPTKLVHPFSRIPDPVVEVVHATGFRSNVCFEIVRSTVYPIDHQIDTWLQWSSLSFHSNTIMSKA